MLHGTQGTGKPSPYMHGDAMQGIFALCAGRGFPDGIDTQLCDGMCSGDLVVQGVTAASSEAGRGQAAAGLAEVCPAPHMPCHRLRRPHRHRHRRHCPASHRNSMFLRRLPLNSNVTLRHPRHLKMGHAMYRRASTGSRQDAALPGMHTPHLPCEPLCLDRGCHDSVPRAFPYNTMELWIQRDGYESNRPHL